MSRWMIGVGFLAVGLCAAADGAECTSRANIYGGRDIRCDDGSRVESRRNSFGGENFSDGGRSRANLFGGQDYRGPNPRAWSGGGLSAPGAGSPWGSR